MSLKSKHAFTCPKCGKEQKVGVYQSINVTLEPDLREQLLSDTLNLFECKRWGCHQQVLLDLPLLYHDMGKHIAIQYYPEAMKGHVEVLEPRSDGIRYLTNPVVVFDREELKRLV